MKNPLTLEEMVTVPRLIGHNLYDSKNRLVQAANGEISLDRDEVIKISSHINRILGAIEIMTKPGDHYRDEFTGDKLMILFRILDVAHDQRKNTFTYNSEVSCPFETAEEPMYAALHNLTSNSLRLVDQSAGNVHVEATEFEGKAPNLVYVCDETPTSDKFIKISVRDDGHGFPADRDSATFLENQASTRGEGYGFGLHFVRLACKYLRSHLAIESKEGDTTVTIYHPLTMPE